MITKPVAFALLLLMAGSARAAVVTSLDADTIDEMESVTLTVRVAGTMSTDDVDTTVLERDFEVLTTATNSQFRSVNGRVQSWVEYQFVLRPRRTGVLEVPPLDFGGEASEPIRLNVRPMDPGVRQAIAELVFFETNLEPRRVWVQAQTVLTRRLFYGAGVQIYSDLPGVPELADAVVVALGDATTSTTTRQGRTYGVVEQRFAVFPERSGTLTIPSIAVTSSIRLQFGGRLRRSGVRVASEEIELEVLPIPPEYPASEPWLPAGGVRLIETWSPQPPGLTVGQPVGRVLTVNALGTTASAIPPLDATVPASHFRQYPEPEQQADDTSGATVLGARIQAYSIVPTAPGETTLPEVHLTWWNTATGTVETAVLPERSVAVTGAVPPAPDVAGESQPVAPAGAGTQTPSRSWLWALAVLVMLAVAFVAGRFAGRVPRDRTARPRRSSTRQEAAPSAPGESPAGVRPSPSAHPSAKAAFDALKKACKGNDPATMRAALIGYLATAWQMAPAEVAKRLRDHKESHDVLQRLDTALYGRASTQGVTGQEVLAVARQAALAPPSAGGGNGRANGDLPELYPG